MPTVSSTAGALAAAHGTCTALKAVPPPGPCFRPCAPRSSGALPPIAARRQRRRRPAGGVAASAAQQQPKETAKEAAVTREYMAWASGAGIESPKLTQAYFEGGLRGAKALQAIAPDEVRWPGRRGGPLLRA